MILQLIRSQLTIRFIMVQLLLAVCTTLFPFFIDEGTYSLSGIDFQRDAGLLLAYSAVLFVAQSLLRILMHQWSESVRTTLSFLLGIPLGFFFLFGLGVPLACLIQYIFN